MPHAAKPATSSPDIRWRILLLLVAARAGLGLQFQTMASVGDDVAVAFGLDHAGIGLLIGLFMLPGLVLALPAGFLGRLVSDRLLASGGLALLCAGGLLSGLADGTGAIGAGRMIAGAGFLVTTLYFTKMIADWFDGREIATAMSALAMAWPLGIALGQIGHAWLALGYGWPAPFLAASAYCAVAALAILAAYRAPDRRAARPSARLTLSRREWTLIILAGLAWALFNAGYIVYLGFAPQMLQALGQAPVTAAAIISVASWVMIASGILCGRLADSFGGRGPILAVAMVASALALGLVTLPGGGIAGSLLLGLVGMAPAGVIMAMAGAALPPEARAFGMGVFFTLYHVATTAAPPVAGALRDATDSAAAPLVLGGALFLAVLPAVIAYGRVINRPETGGGSGIPEVALK
jgi:predicted MFS family arabinose efflux permease